MPPVPARLSPLLVLLIVLLAGAWRGVDLASALTRRLDKVPPTKTTTHVPAIPLCESIGGAAGAGGSSPPTGVCALALPSATNLEGKRAGRGGGQDNTSRKRPGSGQPGFRAFDSQTTTDSPQQNPAKPAWRSRDYQTRALAEAEAGVAAIKAGELRRRYAGKGGITRANTPPTDSHSKAKVASADDVSRLLHGHFVEEVNLAALLHSGDHEKFLQSVSSTLRKTLRFVGHSDDVVESRVRDLIGMADKAQAQGVVYIRRYLDHARIWTVNEFAQSIAKNDDLSRWFRPSNEHLEAVRAALAAARRTDGAASMAFMAHNPAGDGKDWILTPEEDKILQEAYPRSNEDDYDAYTSVRAAIIAGRMMYDEEFIRMHMKRGGLDNSGGVPGSSISKSDGRGGVLPAQPEDRIQAHVNKRIGGKALQTSSIGTIAHIFENGNGDIPGNVHPYSRKRGKKRAAYGVSGESLELEGSLSVYLSIFPNRPPYAGPGGEKKDQDRDHEDLESVTYVDNPIDPSKILSRMPNILLFGRDKDWDKEIGEKIRDSIKRIDFDKGELDDELQAWLEESIQKIPRPP